MHDNYPITLSGRYYMSRPPVCTLCKASLSDRWYEIIWKDRSKILRERWDSCATCDGRYFPDNP